MNFKLEKHPLTLSQTFSASPPPNMNTSTLSQAYSGVIDNYVSYKEWFMTEQTEKYPDMVNKLHTDASTLEKTALSNFVLNSDSKSLYKTLELSKSLRIAANYLDGVEG